MKKEKIILLFSDIEGTLVDEEIGSLNQDNIKKFLNEIVKLQELTDSKVAFHLVSPLSLKDMEKLMDEINSIIAKYNVNRNNNLINKIECSVAYPEDDTSSEKFLSDRIFRFEFSKSDSLDDGRYGKRKYVKSWIDTYKESETKDLIMALYCGNGLNDIDAMQYVLNQDSSFVICPSNSREEVKKIASFLSDKNDILGISDGLNKINERIYQKKKSRDEILR